MFVGVAKTELYGWNRLMASSTPIFMHAAGLIVRWQSRGAAVVEKHLGRYDHIGRRTKYSGTIGLACSVRNILVLLSHRRIIYRRRTFIISWSYAWVSIDSSHERNMRAVYAANAEKQLSCPLKALLFKFSLEVLFIKKIFPCRVMTCKHKHTQSRVTRTPSSVWFI